MASRDINQLSLTMRSLALDFLEDCAGDRWLLDNGIKVLITCTYRSHAEQNELYAQGRTKPGKIVTRAQGGQSKHNAVDSTGQPAAEALDVVPLRYGKPVWGAKGNGIDDDPLDDATDDLEAWQRIGAIGKECGLKWYGDPDASFREFPHFQNPEA